MYLSSSNISAPTPFSPTPVQYSDINTAAQQQQLHYTLLNFHSAAAAGLISPTPVLGTTNNTNGTQSSNQTNDSSQQTTSQSNSTLTHPILIENLYNSVLLREKTSNQSYDPRKTRKRLSDPVYSNHQPLQPLIINQQQNNFHPILPTNQNLLHDLSNQTLHRRRSLRFIKPPTILQTIPQQISIQHESQKLLVVRHAERVDSTFGAGWLDQVFDKTTGIYRRINLNLPKKMVTRRDLKDFLFDPPLTELGLHECKMVGEELRAQGIDIHHVYASPALRCVQTADKILEGLQLRDEISIRIEPCLFEFLKWYPVVPVKWPFLDLDELTKNGFNVDTSYKPFYPIESLRKDEDELMYYTRSHFIATSILKNHQADGGNLLLVGHVISIEFRSFFF